MNTTITGTTDRTAARRLRRIALVPLALMGLGALIAHPADADPATKNVQGRMDFSASSGPCGSPVGACLTGTFSGALHGSFELAGQSVAPTADPNVVVINSTSVLHTDNGDLFFSNSAVWDVSPGSDGPESSVDRITGGTGRWAGASGYLQTIGRAVLGGQTTAEYVGKVVLA